jgi:hypothetical protein
LNKAAKFIFILVIAILFVVAITNLAGGTPSLLGIKQPQRWTYDQLISKIPVPKASEATSDAGPGTKPKTSIVQKELSPIKSIEFQQDNRTISGSLTSGADDKFVADGPASESPSWTALQARIDV